MNTHLPWNLLLIKVVLVSIFGAGAFLCALNFYLSFLRYPLYRLRGRESEYRYVSGAPVLGSFLVVALLIPPALPTWARIAGLVLAAFDTGGLHWFIGVTAWLAIKKARASRPQS